MTGSKDQNRFRITTRSTRVIDCVCAMRSLKRSSGTVTKLSSGLEYVNAPSSTAKSTANKGGRRKRASFFTVLQSVTVTCVAVQVFRNEAYSLTLFVRSVRMQACVGTTPSRRGIASTPSPRPRHLEVS